ncbi:MAG TPA: GNAT family N-acetyltransferase [Actinomycetota bacterium]
MIRRYLPTDAEDVIRVWLDSTIPGQPFLPEDRWRAMEGEIRYELMPIADSWVVEQDGELVAFVSIIDHTIGGLFTHPDHQGEGHGRALVELARAIRDPLFVEVFEANEAATRFYRHRGFVDHDRTIDEASGLPLLILRMDASENVT